MIESTADPDGTSNLRMDIVVGFENIGKARSDPLIFSFTCGSRPEGFGTLGTRNTRYSPAVFDDLYAHTPLVSAGLAAAVHGSQESGVLHYRALHGDLHGAP